MEEEEEVELTGFGFAASCAYENCGFSVLGRRLDINLVGICYTGQSHWVKRSVFKKMSGDLLKAGVEPRNSVRQYKFPLLVPKRRKNATLNGKGRDKKNLRHD